MSGLVLALAFLSAGAILSFPLSAFPRLSRWMSLLCLTGGCATGLAAALFVLAGGEVSGIRIAWMVPMGEIFLAIDPLTAFFLVPIFAVGLASGVYGEGYLEAARGHLSVSYVRFFYFLLTAALVTVVCARNAVLFLAGWEVMALAAFALVCAEDPKPGVRRAGLIYIICTHAGILCLFVLFAAMGSRAGSMDFSAMKAAMPGPGPALTGLFALALTGFGMKAGFMPFHFWLPEAHPVAPSHASAVLSAVVIKMGIYGLLRFISFCPAVPESWGLVFLAIGASSGILGVLFALAQHDLKRLLAYHSIENIGIIALGMGVGCLGLARGNSALMTIGFAAALLHVLNHSLFKSLLFLGAGAYDQALGSRDIEGAGGLLRRMPWVSVFSWIGAAAICGLPPFNGFVSEWLVYFGLLGGRLGGARPAMFAAAALATIGALAAACFTKAYGALTLGEPRAAAAAAAVDPGELMLWPMALLAVSCLAIGIFPGPFVLTAARCAATIGRLSPGEALPAVEAALHPLTVIGAMGALALGLAGLLWLWRGALLSLREVGAAPTWGCGFTKPTARMQYTASSYAQPLVSAFAGVLNPDIRLHAPSGYWPKQASFHSHTPDLTLDRALIPALGAVERALAVVRRAQHGRLQYYLLYVFGFLVCVLLWKL
ncbi:MAG: proton-conducting transporter membrane subunit [Elusimicrobia bacterium]|nr:proton-conducting transporter membrane subunit [Elusimicrobiota bacterium]